MTKPLAICLEDVQFTEAEERYLCCAVEVGRAPGLSLDNKGTTHWRVNNDMAFQLFVTMDDCLGLYRLPFSVAVQVHRAGRTLDAPCEKPVILRHGDELVIAHRHYRVHFHGRVSKSFTPFYFKEHFTRVTQTLAAVVLGAAITSTGCDNSFRQDVADNCSPEAAQGGLTSHDLSSFIRRDLARAHSSLVETMTTLSSVSPDSPDSDNIEVRLSPPLVGLDL